MAMQKPSPRSPRNTSIEHALPPAFRPVFRAYILGRRRKNIDEQPDDSFFLSLFRILKGGLEFQRFPTFCAALVGGSTLLQLLARKLLATFAARLSKVAQLRLARWLSTFIAAWFSLKLLQSKDSDAFVDYVAYDTPTGRVERPKRWAGRTMDLSLFAVTRALDVIIGELWSQRKARRTASGKWSKFDTAATLADPWIFSTSCALIMWAWIYTPDRLPRSYNKWIKSAAAVDQRLLIALRRMRHGEIKYGVETGQAHLLQGMCRHYHWPLDYGDPVKSIPFPCEMVHMGTGKNCEYHAVSRLVRSFFWAFSTYLPLNILLTLRKPSKKAITNAVKSSARSSAFLGTFIALYYYGICLMRTRIGPRILGTSTPARSQIDSGICVGGGCTLCGWSVLVENAGRRKELGLFVAPRALATILPRRYLMEDQWKETLAFAMSTAVVFTCVGEKPARVRGVLGKLLHEVLTQ